MSFFDRVIDRFTTRRRGSIGAAVLRVGLATVMVTTYVWHVGLRDAIWGVNGQVDFAHFLGQVGRDPLALYRYSTAHVYTDALFACSLAVALLYAFGIATRVTCWLFAVTSYATLWRNTFAADAGLFLLVLLATLLCLTDSGRYLAPFRRRTSSYRRSTTIQLATLLHNGGRFLLAWQICMVYYWAAFYKTSGLDWRNGTALYYVLSNERFSLVPQLTHPLVVNGVIVAVLTYGTLAFQTAFPFLMWNQRLKPAMILIGVSLHAGIALFMGLISFSCTMMVADVSLLSDEQFRFYGRKVRELARAAGTAFARIRSSAAAAPR